MAACPVCHRKGVNEWGTPCSQCVGLTRLPPPNICVECHSKMTPSPNGRRKCKECLRKDARARSKNRYKSDSAYREKVLSSSKAYQKANRDKMRESERKYRNNNRDKVAFKEEMHKFRKKNAIGYCSYNDWIIMLDICNNRCLLCYSTENLTIDHVIPLAVFLGTNYISNLQPLCHSCNSSKGNRIIIDYRWKVYDKLTLSLDMSLPQSSIPQEQIYIE